MKTLIIAVITIITLSINLNAQEQIKIDPKTSIIHWKGSMIFSFGGHEGTVKFNTGKLLKSNGKLSGGNFTIDMNSIRNTDGDYNEGLIEHLSNKDFFNVSEFPLATLVIKDVKYREDGLIETQADLTIKGISKPIKYVADFDAKQNTYSAKFIIDRTDWDIVYGTKATLDVKDYAISDAIEFDVLLKF